MLAFRYLKFNNRAMSTTLECRPVLEGFGEAFRQPLLEELARALGVVSPNADNKGHGDLADALRKLELGTEFDYLPDELKERLSLQLLYLVGLFANSPGLRDYIIFDGTYLQQSEEETALKREINTFIDVLSEKIGPTTFDARYPYLAFGDNYSTVIPEIYIYLSDSLDLNDAEDLSGDEIGKDLPAAGKIRLSVFRAKIIKGKLVRIGWL